MAGEGNEEGKQVEDIRGNKMNKSRGSERKLVGGK